VVKSNLTMDDLLAESPAKIKAGDMVEGTITSVKKNEVWVDMGANGIGVIFRREVGGGGNYG
jgi:ribosomal protein S1